MHTPDTHQSLTTKEQVLDRLSTIIAQVTGNSLHDVLPEAQLEDELGVTPVDFKRIITEINRELELELDVRDLLEQEVETVQELAVIVSEELLLG